MSRPTLFLDIDGVLNGHEYDPEAESNTLRRDCVARLNRVLAETDCAVVLSSAWRYMVLNGAMTITGFGYMLRTHGVRIRGGLVGTTDRDTQTEDPGERGRQIQAWLAAHPEVTRFAVVDDMREGFEGLPIVRTDGRCGLTDADAEALIALLRGQDAPARCSSLYHGLRCQKLAGHDQWHEHDNRERSVGWGDTASDEACQAGAP